MYTHSSNLSALARDSRNECAPIPSENNNITCSDVGPPLCVLERLSHRKVWMNRATQATPRGNLHSFGVNASEREQPGSPFMHSSTLFLDCTRVVTRPNSPTSLALPEARKPSAGL